MSLISLSIFICFVCQLEYALLSLEVMFSKCGSLDIRLQLELFHERRTRLNFSFFCPLGPLKGGPVAISAVALQLIAPNELILFTSDSSSEADILSLTLYNFQGSPMTETQWDIFSLEMRSINICE